jgi:large subunit ribosomal protein L3
MTGFLAKKVGMTQVFSDQGAAVPVTVLQAAPNVVVRRKTLTKDGYDAVQLGGPSRLRRSACRSRRSGCSRRAKSLPSATCARCGCPPTAT